MITNSASGTNIHEIAADIYRINTPVAIPGTPGFSFNQYLVVDDEPFLFHTGLRRLFPVVSEAIAAVMPVARLKYVALSHFEADECGAINEFLTVAPNAVPVCGRVAAMTSVNDFADRLPKVLADNEELDLGHLARADVAALQQVVAEQQVFGEAVVQHGQGGIDVVNGLADVVAAPEQVLVDR